MINKKEHVKEEVKEYTNGDVLKVINKLPEYARDILLTCTNISDIRKALNKEFDFQSYYENLMLLADYYKVTAETLKRIMENVDSMLMDEPRSFSSDYDHLSDAEKKNTALELLNNSDFQKNCCDILVKDFHRIVKEDSFLSALDNLLGLGKYYDKCIRAGIGCNHKYQI